MHPFARFIQILGKGRNGMRPLSQAEAQLKQHRFAYLPISELSLPVAELIASRELFGLQSPLCSLALMIRGLGIVTGYQEVQRMAVAWWRQRHVTDWAQEAL